MQSTAESLRRHEYLIIRQAITVLRPEHLEIRGNNLILTKRLYPLEVVLQGVADMAFAVE